MDTGQISQVLAANKAQEIAPQSKATSALKEVGVAAKELGDKDLVKAQGRLLTAMEEVQKAAGGTSSLLRSADLGGAAVKTSGELPSSELKKILAAGGKASDAWSFKQVADGTIVAVEHAKHVPGETLTRAQVASAVASKFESNYGAKVLTQTLESTVRLAAQSSVHTGSMAEEAWKPGQSVAASDKSTVVAREARYSVAQAMKSGEFAVESAEARGQRKVAEEVSKSWAKFLATDFVEKTATKAAESAALKAGGKIAGKSVPVIGAGFVLADMAGAGKDAVASTMDGRYKDAGIDTVRAVSKLGFGVGTQLGNVTLVGGVAVAGAGEGVDYWLQKQKSTGQALPESVEKEKMVAAFRNSIHNPDSLKSDQELIKYVNSNPGLKNAIGVYHGIANSSKDLPETQRQSLLNTVEVNGISAIQDGKLSEIKAPTGKEISSAVQNSANQSQL